jgi:site-specific DNA-methyltransferase (adenine-specific)
MEEPIPNHLYKGDCLEVMRQWPDACVDHCIADPPFGIASGRGRRGKRGLGWAFSSHVTMDEAWDRFSEKDDFFRFNVDWLSEVCRVVRPNGNILVFGTFHNIYQLGFILQNVLNRRVNNSIVWFKPNAQPNITARTLTESTEQIVWAVNETPERAANWVFNYRIAKELGDDRQMRTFWTFPDSDNVKNVSAVPVVQKEVRKHPSQKPLQLVNRLVRVATTPNELILDPFAGSGVVALSALRYRRRYVLIELLPEYVAAAEAAIGEFPRTKRGRLIGHHSALTARFADDELDILTETPVPQADELDLVFRVPGLVRAGAETRSQLAGALSYVPRQGPYYADAAIALRLVQAVGPVGKTGQRLEVTPLGMEWLRASGADKRGLQREVVLTAPIVKYVASDLGIDPQGAADMSALLDEARVAGVLESLDLSPNTARRRAATLCGWLSRVSQRRLRA